MTSFAYPLRFVVGLILALVAGLILIGEGQAHVTMCMIGAIGYGIGLAIHDQQQASRIASFFFSWVLFYTVYTATTLLAIELFVGNTGLFEYSRATGDIAWTYHTVINIVLLLLFWLKLDSMQHVLTGFWSAMIVAPAMFLLAFIGRSLWQSEPASLIIGYFGVGIVLMLGHLWLEQHQNTEQRTYQILRTFIQATLYGYVVLTLLPYLL